jgi:hypothetical protein
MQDGAPIYVKVEDYKGVLDIIALIKDKIREADTILHHISDVKVKEDSEIESWKLSLDEIKQRVSDIDTTLLDVKSV